MALRVRPGVSTASARRAEYEAGPPPVVQVHLPPPELRPGGSLCWNCGQEGELQGEPGSQTGWFECAPCETRWYGGVKPLSW